MNENEPLRRRDVLKATAATVAAGVGATSVVGADVEPNYLYPIGQCVVVNRETQGYGECPGENPIETLSVGTSGKVTENCVVSKGNHWVEVQWDCYRRSFVDPAYISQSMNCC